MNSPLDTIEYLARSEHRVEVLGSICTAPRTREEIRDTADASRVTVGRIIADLEERDWIVRTGRRYEATPRGAFVAAEFIRLMRNLETFEALPPVSEWFPDDEPAFDLCLLDDATVVTADEGDLIAPIRRGLELIERSDHLRAVANGASREFIEATREAVDTGSTHTILVPPETVDAMRADPDLRAGVRKMLDTGNATLLRYDGDGELPVVQIGDGTVALCSGDHRAMVETGDGEVRDWAEGYLDSLLADATPISAEHIAADDPPTEGEAVVD